MNTQTKNSLVGVVIAALLALFVACVAVPRPETFNQRLAMAYGTVTALRDTTTALLKAGSIDATDAANVQAQADAARTGLDIARMLSAGDLSTANARLTASQATLQALQVYLQSRHSATSAIGASAPKGTP